jgi:hypothetical protein
MQPAGLLELEFRDTAYGYCVHTSPPHPVSTMSEVPAKSPSIFAKRRTLETSRPEYPAKATLFDAKHQRFVAGFYSMGKWLADARILWGLDMNQLPARCAEESSMV